MSLTAMGQNGFAARRPRAGILVCGIAGLLMLWSGGAVAQTKTECISPQTQSLMNACAAEEYGQADDALNIAWRSAKAFGDAIGQGDALLRAQRAWLVYRDAACTVQASPFEGGSLQPLIRSTCLTQLTQERTRMLLEFNAY